MRGIPGRTLLRTLARWRRENEPHEHPPGRSAQPPGCHPYVVELASEADERDIRALRDTIFAYNRSKAGDQHYRPLILWLRDDDQRIVGGVVGSTYWGWLLTDFLWVDAGIRGRGLGRQLLMAAEREAMRRGCRYACLETFSFQAPTFYEKLGYVVFGTLHDFPSGHRRYSLKKQLEPPATTPE